MLKNINEACDYIYSFINLEKSDKYTNKLKNSYTLNNIHSILKFFNNPDKNQNIIHIAGTKGKGSTSIIISYLLNLLDLNTTVFLSPHLIDLNERFLYNKHLISNNEIINLTNKIKKVLSKNNLKPTMFELLFILYLLFSIKKKPDYLVIETGIGGRLDSTNIVDPIISVITPISIDHTNILGKTIINITREKGGIIKKNKKVVLCNQNFISRKILRKIAFKKRSEIFEINKEFKLLTYKTYKNGMIFDFKFNNIIIKNFFISLLGVHQIYNFFTALKTVYLIKPEILNVIKKMNKLNIQIPGRIQILRKNPPIILDVAHNNESAVKLRNTLLLHFPNVKWTVLSGMTAEKDYKNFYKKLKKIIDQLFITTPSIFKNSNSKEVYNNAKTIIKKTFFIPLFDEAFEKVLLQKKPLLITGSFYIAGPFLDKWKKLNIN